MNFVRSMQEKHGALPKFAHSLSNPQDDKVHYAGPYFDDNELVAAIDTLLFGKWSSSGEICAQFEREFAKITSQKFGFFCNSGSSANLLLIAACKEYFGWKDGDGILVSPVGFPTTVSAIVQNGLVPVFIDIEWGTLNFDLRSVEKTLSKHYSILCPEDYPETQKWVPPRPIKAIFISPVLGNPPDMYKLLTLGNAYGAKLLLDGCDSLGSKYAGVSLPAFAVASSCSFYPAHEITTLEGGMVTSDIPEIVQLARSYGTWGRDCWCVGSCNLLPNGTCCKRFSNWLPSHPDLIVDHKYVFNRIGWNLKPLDLQAAIGLEQLKKLDKICEIRRFNQTVIHKLFSANIPDLKFPKILSHSYWVPFGVPIICKDKEQKRRLVKYLEENGIQTRNYFAGNLLLHVGYQHLGDYRLFPEANKVLDLVFFVGCSPTISEGNLKHIEKVLSQWRE